MAESRINSYNKLTDEVSWYYDDHTTNERITVNETGLDLVKKIIIHIPDKDFRMVRYYGFYNNKCIDTLDKVNKLLGKEISYYVSKEKKKENT